jgi:hypothetical protein
MYTILVILIILSHKLLACLLVQTASQVIRNGPCMFFAANLVWWQTLLRCWLYIHNENWACCSWSCFALKSPDHDCNKGLITIAHLDIYNNHDLVFSNHDLSFSAKMLKVLVHNIVFFGQNVIDLKNSRKDTWW